MILNISRAIAFQACRRKTWYQNELFLRGLQDVDALRLGSGFHKGIAALLATRDLHGAKEIAEDSMREALVGRFILPEEMAGIERQIEQVKCSLAQYHQHYNDKDLQVLMPEAKYIVPLPGTMHHCWYVHRILHPDVLFDQCFSRPGMASERGCWQPHYLCGTTDAIIKWRQMIWLMEHKTSAGGQFADPERWYFHFQPTSYIYGLWKSTGLRANGFILNTIIKPRKNASDQFAFNFQREPILKSDDDLVDFEQQIIEIVEEYERATVRAHMRNDNSGLHSAPPTMYMNPNSCFDYFRKCSFYSVCHRLGDILPGEFDTIPGDYTTGAYYKMLGMEPPADLPEEAKWV